MTTRLEPTSQTIDVNGLRVHYLDWSNPGAPPVVCVHGYTSSAQAFNALARRFHDRYHFVAMDVRGHGESAWSPAGAYQYRDQVDDLAAVVDKLGLSRFTLIGTSMGGIIAMAYAGAHPDRLTHLVINDIGPDVEVGSQRITQMVGSQTRRVRDPGRGDGLSAPDVADRGGANPGRSARAGARRTPATT